MAAYSTLFHDAGRGWGMRRRSRFGSVERLASGRYRARYTARRADADGWLARQRTALEDHVLRPAILARRMTLQEYADAWLRDRRSASGQPLRPSTRRVYEHYLVKLIYPELGEVLLIELTPAMVSLADRRASRVCRVASHRTGTISAPEMPASQAKPSETMIAPDPIAPSAVAAFIAESPAPWTSGRDAAGTDCDSIVEAGTVTIDQPSPRRKRPTTTTPADDGAATLR